MNFIEEYKPIVEFLYLLSGPLLLLGLAIAAFQLALFRQETKDRFKRETILLSLSSLEKKIRRFESFQKIIWDLQNKEFVHFQGEISGFYTTGIHCTNTWSEWIKSHEGSEIFTTVNDLLNEIETLSQYIYSGLLDEDLCFKLEGTHILQYIEENKHYIAMFRESESDPVFSGIVRLHENWSVKIDHHNLITKKGKIDNELKIMKKPETTNIIGSNRKIF